MSASFIVIAITKYSDATARVELAPDESDEVSLTNFWGGKAIGRIELTIANPQTIASFYVGSKYNVGFNQIA